MKASLAITCIVAGALITGGCATKKYVRNTTAPVQAKVDQVGQQTTQNSQQIHETQDQVKQVDEKAQNGINAASEKASSADQHAGEAMNKANGADQHAAQADQHAAQADHKADQANQGLASLRDTVANIDDYKVQTTTTVSFKFNDYKLSPEARQELDQLATNVQADKRFFIAVEGFTDNSGSREYNEGLSRRRADAVVEYLVAKHDIPVYRIHMVGLGPDKPVDETHNRAARAKNRRVEVKVFSADQVTAALSGNGANSANREAPEAQH